MAHRTRDQTFASRERDRFMIRRNVMKNYKFATPELERSMLGVFAAERINPTYDKMKLGQVDICLDTFRRENRDVYMKIITDFSKGEFECWIKSLYFKHKKQYTPPPTQKMVLDADIQEARSTELRTKSEVLRANNRGLPQIHYNKLKLAERLGFTVVGSKTTRLYQIREGDTVVAGENWDLTPSDVENYINTAIPKLVGEPCDLVGLNIQDVNKKLKKVVDTVGEGKDIEEYRKLFVKKYRKDFDEVTKWWSIQKLKYDRNHKKFNFTINEAVCQLIKRYFKKRETNQEPKES